MKKLIILLFPIIFVGCVTIEIPEQIKEAYTYTRSFNADFESSIEAASRALEDLGWKVSYISRSKLTKKDRTLNRKPKYQAHIFTKIRQAHLFLVSSYSTFNVRLESIDEGHTEIDVRYLSITLIPPFYKKITRYRNDKLVEKLYVNIQRYLSK